MGRKSRRYASICAAGAIAAALLIAPPAVAGCDQKSGDAMAEIDCPGGWGGTRQYFERAPGTASVKRSETARMNDGLPFRRRDTRRQATHLDDLDGDRPYSKPGGGYGASHNYRGRSSYGHSSYGHSGYGSSGYGGRRYGSRSRLGSGGRRDGGSRYRSRRRTSLGTVTGKDPWWMHRRRGLGTARSRSGRYSSGSHYTLGTLKGTQRRYRDRTDYGLGTRRGNPYHYDGTPSSGLGTVGRSPRWDRRKSLSRGTFRPY